MNRTVSLTLTESAYEVFFRTTHRNTRWRRWFKPVGAYSDYRSSELRSTGRIVDRETADRRTYQTGVTLSDTQLLNLLETWAWLDVWSEPRILGYTKRRPIITKRSAYVREIRFHSDWWDLDCQEHAEQYAEEFLEAEGLLTKEIQPNYSRMASLLLEAIANEDIKVEGEELFG